MEIKNKVNACIICCCIFWSFTCFGQTDRENIPLGALPMQYNPSFAGEAGAGRISTSTFYYGLNNNLNFSREQYGFYTSYDQFISPIGTGIGITAGFYGSKGDSRLNFHNRNYSYLSLAIAPKISIKGKYTLSPSLEFSGTSGTFYEWENGFYNLWNNRLSSKAGILFNTQKYYIGYSVYILDQAKRTAGNSYHRKNRFISYLQLGYTFQRSSDSKFSITPQIVVSLSEKSQSELDVVEIAAVNLNFRYKQYMAGLNNTGFHLGIQKEKLRIMFSSRLGLSTSYEPYSGNLSFRYVFANADKPGGRSGF